MDTFEYRELVLATQDDQMWYLKTWTGGDEAELHAATEFTRKQGRLLIGQSGTLGEVFALLNRLGGRGWQLIRLEHLHPINRGETRFITLSRRTP